MSRDKQIRRYNRLETHPFDCLVGQFVSAIELAQRNSGTQSLFHHLFVSLPFEVVRDGARIKMCTNQTARECRWSTPSLVMRGPGSNKDDEEDFILLELNATQGRSNVPAATGREQNHRVEDEQVPKIRHDSAVFIIVLPIEYPTGTSHFSGQQTCRCKVA